MQDGPYLFELETVTWGFHQEVLQTYVQSLKLVAEVSSEVERAEPAHNVKIVGSKSFHFLKNFHLWVVQKFVSV